MMNCLFTHKSIHAHTRTHRKGKLLHNVSEKKDTNYIHGKYRNAMPSKNNDTCNVTNQCTGKQFFILEMP